MKTYSAKPSEVTRQWFVIDAESVPVGRLATLAATYLMGKHKPMYTAHIDCGDAIIVINAEKLKLTGNKLAQKVYYRHSGRPGSLKETTAAEMLIKNPTEIVRQAVYGMLPRNKLQAVRMNRLKIYVGNEHDQTAQQPQLLEIN
ncbi:50S ribosomal protein L13 [Candidatus Microgenomates bacterium]|nr:50S ribosomal protein L13 [Candidatus Microgenomates bacterium]